jgi:hypothetical protein
VGFVCRGLLVVPVPIAASYAAQIFLLTFLPKS